MTIVTVEEVKSFLRIEGEEDDAIVATLIAAAEAYALRYTGEFLEEGEEYPDDFKLAVLMLVGTYFNNRESVLVGKSAQEMPFGVREILKGLRMQRTG